MANTVNVFVAWSLNAGFFGTAVANVLLFLFNAVVALFIVLSLLIVPIMYCKGIVK
jgi:hypothetical protein